MKKSIVVISSLLLVTILSGCTNQTDINDLDNTTNIISDNIEEPMIEEYSYYDISNESSSQIVNDIKYFIDNRPKNKETYDSIYNRFQDRKVDITKSNKDNPFIVLKYTNRFDNSNLYNGTNTPDIIKDEFISVSYTAPPAMNNTTVDIDENCISTKIYFTISDYDKAEEIFDLLEDYVNENPRFSAGVYLTEDGKIPVNTTGTTWTITFDVVSLDGNGSHGPNTVTLNQINGGYLFTIHIN